MQAPANRLTNSTGRWAEKLRALACAAATSTTATAKTPRGVRGSRTVRLGSSECSFDPPAHFFVACDCLFAEPGFRDDLYRARDVRGDYTFGEQILDISDDGTNDRVTAKNGAQVVNKELVLRSKLRIEARKFHMSRLQVQTSGEKQQIAIKDDWALLSEDERGRKADELIVMIRELQAPPMQPPPLVYRPEEAPEQPEPVRALSQTRPAAGPKS